VLSKSNTHNAQIDKTVMIHDGGLHSTTTLQYSCRDIARHEVGLMQADKPGLGLKEPQEWVQPCALEKVVLHNAQIDKTVMIHD
jgi:hypothetical protein